jgi:hypothetical protein
MATEDDFRARKRTFSRATIQGRASGAGDAIDWSFSNGCKVAARLTNDCMFADGRSRLQLEFPR